MKSAGDVMRKRLDLRVDFAFKALLAHTGMNPSLDVHAQLEDGSRINIEIQLNNKHDMEKKNLVLLVSHVYEPDERGNGLWGALPNHYH